MEILISTNAAESADEALEIIHELDEKTVPILIIVSDWLMPGMKGDEFLIQVHEKYPQIIKLMLTGQADEEAIERVQEQANLYHCLHKPWNASELIATIKTASAKSRIYRAYGRQGIGNRMALGY